MKNPLRRVTSGNNSEYFEQIIKLREILDAKLTPLSRNAEAQNKSMLEFVEALDDILMEVTEVVE